jgi:hypothetical protein
MRLFSRKTMIEQLENELTSLRTRAETLSNRLAAAETAFVDADAKLQHHLLEADLDGDEKVRAKLEAAVAACALTRDNFAKALAAQQARVASTEQTLAAEIASVRRKDASEKLARDLDKAEKALPEYLDASRRFVAALEELHHHYEATQMATFVGNTTSQVEVAAGFTLVELRGMVSAIAEGRQPIPAAKPEPAPVTVIEPAPPQTTVFMIKSAKYRGDGGKMRFCGQYEDCTMPHPVAQKALHCGAAVPINDDRRRTLRGCRAGDFRFDAPDIVDLDNIEKPKGAPYIGLADDPVLREANFTILDRGPDRILQVMP